MWTRAVEAVYICWC